MEIGTKTQAVFCTQDVDLSYVGGFVDGEAYIGLVPRRSAQRPHPCYRLNVSITQNDLQVLEQVRAILNSGGKIYPVRRSLKHNRQVWVLTYDGRHAHAAITRVLPYLRRKQHLAQMCLQAWIEGKLDQHSGPKGWPSSLWKRREALCKKVRKML